MSIPAASVSASTSYPAVFPRTGWWDVTIGIITALPVEGAAMAALITSLEDVRVDGDPNHYRVGLLESADPDRPHRVVLTTMPQDNTRNAAATCTDLVRTFTGVRCVIMTGIAGGIPAPEQPDRHVRLGDVVVADGIVDYAHVRLVDGTAQLRRSVDGISLDLVRAARELEVRSYESGAARLPQWVVSLDGHRSKTFGRPPASTDRLYINGRFVRHPQRSASGHPRGYPKVHRGAVACADVLLRDERQRDALAARHGIVAVEMEGSGIAAGAALHGIHWFMVRGVADYCENAGKTDRWHGYASLTAASYVRAVLQTCRPFPGRRSTSSTGVAPVLADRERHILFGLLELVPRIDLEEIWRAMSLDLAPIPGTAPRTIYELVDYLAGINAGKDGVPPVLALVEEISRRVTGGLAGELRAWVDEVSGQMDLTDVIRRHRRSARAAVGRADLSPDAQPCVVIQIVLDGIDRSRCTVAYWIQHYRGRWQPQPGAEPTQTRLDAVETVVEAAIRHAEEAWWRMGDSVAVEFLLPTDLLHVAVEWWHLDLESAAPLPLCLDYPVAVRSLDRMRARFQRRVWRNRWQALWREPPAHRLYWGSSTGDSEPDLMRWNARLHDDTDVTSVVLSASPQDDAGRAELQLALRAGIPVIVWDRRTPLPKEAAAAIEDLAQGRPDELHGKLAALRSAAARTTGEDQGHHPGRHMALLWDDPYRPIDE
jgi:nucleoside phosphorylase